MNNLFKITSLILFTLLITSCDKVGKKYYYNLGSNNQKDGNYKEAIDCYNKVIDLDSTFINAYISKGSSYLDLQNYKESIISFEEALNIDSNNAEAYAYMGRAYYEDGNKKLALKSYDKAIVLNNKFGYAYYNRGLLLYTMFQYLEGCSDLEKALSLGYEEAEELLKEANCDKIKSSSVLLNN